VEVSDGFWWDNLRERDYLVGVGIDGRIILTWNLNREWEDVEWIRVAQGRVL
jgi:hypothetical protein